MQFHSLLIKDIQKETNDTVSIAFEIPQNLQADYTFIPGQYITLKTSIDGEDIRRAYSVCSSPFEKELRVAIKQIPGGVFSTFANNELKQGDHLEVMTPNGHFYSEYSASNKKNYVGFVAGSGITPVLSIIKHVLHTEQDSKFTLFYGNKEVESIIFGKELDGIKNQYPARFSAHYIFSQENHGMDLFHGRIDTDKLNIWSKGLFQVSNTDEYFMCGPETMTQEIRNFLDANKVDSKKVHFELFNTSGSSDEKVQIETSKKVTANIKVIVDDEEYEFELGSDGADILQAGVDAGVDLPFSCKGGVCSTCKAKVLEGEATMKLNYSLLDEEVEAGYILTCQAHPKSEKLVVSFDD